MKKKEIWIVVIIVIFTVCLALLPSIINKTKNNTTNDTTIIEEEKNSTITIKIEGEINTSSLTIVVPYGSTYRYIIDKIKTYLNEYSVIGTDFSTKYYEDCTINIESSDRYSKVEEGIPGKIKISTASYSELISLYGIGDKRANSIIEYREKNTISSWEELRSLLGVSNEIIEAIKEKAVL